MKNLFSLLLLVGLLAACQKDDAETPEKKDLPESEFTFEYDRITDYSFESVTTGNSYRWDFGDGTTSDKRKLYHTFPKAGDYNVSLDVETDEGTRKSTQMVHVEVEDKFIISRKWVVTSGTKNGAEYNDANGATYTFWGDGTVYAGTLQFSWYFDENHEGLTITDGSWSTGWEIVDMTVFDLDIKFSGNDGSNYTYHFEAQEE